MSNRSMCRIGVFYDGFYFEIARRHLYRDAGLGWLEFKPLHKLLEDYIRGREPGYTHYSVVYAAWFQGMYGLNQAREEKLKYDRRQYHDLMHAGIEPKYMPMPRSGSNEKGADVALAVDAIQMGVDGKIDVAVLVTGDGDFVPLVRALGKHGVRVMAAHFDYDVGEQKDYISGRLLNACNYFLNISDMGRHKEQEMVFRGLFRKQD